jgi:hypothetical protein
MQHTARIQADQPSDHCPQAGQKEEDQNQSCKRNPPVNLTNCFESLTCKGIESLITVSLPVPLIHQLDL